MVLFRRLASHLAKETELHSKTCYLRSWGDGKYQKYEPQFCLCAVFRNFQAFLRKEHVKDKGKLVPVLH